MLLVPNDRGAVYVIGSSPVYYSGNRVCAMATIANKATNATVTIIICNSIGMRDLLMPSEEGN